MGQLNTTNRAGEYLSPIYMELQELIGREAATKLAEVYACRLLYIPKTFRPSHRLVPLIGEDALKKLIREYGRTSIDLPPGFVGSMVSRRLHAIELLRQGSSLVETARAIGVSRSTIKNWKRTFVRNEK